MQICCFSNEIRSGLDQIWMESNALMTIKDVLNVLNGQLQVICFVSWMKLDFHN